MKDRLWWKVFAVEYLKNGENATEAYLKVRPNVKRRSAEVEASKLLRNPEFLELLKTERASAEKKLEMSKDEWLRILADISRFDVRNYIKTEAETGDVQLVEGWKDRSDGHAIEYVDLRTTTLESGQVVQRVSIKGWPKIKAMEVLGKALGYISEPNVEVNVTQATELSPELRDHLLKLQTAITQREVSCKRD